MPFLIPRIWRFGVALLSLTPLLAPYTYAAERAETEGDAVRAWWLEKWQQGPQKTAPAGVRGARVLAEGEWALSYRFSHDRFEDLRQGRDNLGTSDVLGLGFDAAPTDIEVQSHEFRLSYAPSPRVTFFASLPLLRVEGDFTTGGQRFSVRSDGVGDLSLGLLLPFTVRDKHSLHFGVELVTPTGGVTHADGVIGAGGPTRQRLGYPFQLGSGTWNLGLAATYLGERGRNHWGVQVNSLFYFGENEQDYRRGSSLQLMTWLSRDWTSWLRTSLRLSWRDANNLREFDRSIDPTFSPTDDRFSQGSSRVELGPGLEIALPGPGAPRLQTEATWTVYENLNGIQLEREWGVTTAILWSF